MTALVFQADDAYRFKPATRVENACATDSAAIHQGLKLIAARQARFIPVVGIAGEPQSPRPSHRTYDRR